MNNQHWTNKYIGIPFREGGRDTSGCDCGGLVLLVLQREFAIQALDFTAYETADFCRHGFNKLADGIESLMREEWAVVDTPQPFDLVRFFYGRFPCHVGLWAGYGNTFLHVEKDGLFTRLTPMTDLSWGPRFMEFRRHKAMIGRNTA